MSGGQVGHHFDPLTYAIIKIWYKMINLLLTCCILKKKKLKTDEKVGSGELLEQTHRNRGGQSSGSHLSGWRHHPPRVGPHPGVLQDLGQRQPLRRLVSEKLADQVLGSQRY